MKCGQQQQSSDTISVTHKQLECFPRSNFFPVTFTRFSNSEELFCIITFAIDTSEEQVRSANGTLLDRFAWRLIQDSYFEFFKYFFFLSM